MGAYTVDWRLCAFNQLTTLDLYELLQLRAQVFVVEQACAFQDLDGADAAAHHLQGHADQQLLAYARCLGPGVKFDEASIGRVVTRSDARGQGLGHLLVKQAITAIRERWGDPAIRIGAQARLKHFYQCHGFADVGRPYVEDGIDHLEMVRQPQGNQEPKHD